MTDRQIDYLEMKRPARYQAEDGWIMQTRQPVVLNFAPSAPGNRYWYGCLLGALGHDYVKEGCILLDYGCGNAPLAVFLSGKLERFEYFGLEPAGSPYIQYAARSPGIHVGYVGSALEQEAIGRAGCAVLGSVFTHLEWKDSCAILDKYAANCATRSDRFFVLYRRHRRLYQQQSLPARVSAYLSLCVHHKKPDSGLRPTQ